MPGKLIMTLKPVPPTEAEKRIVNNLTEKIAVSEIPKRMDSLTAPFVSGQQDYVLLGFLAGYVLGKGDKDSVSNTTVRAVREIQRTTMLESESSENSLDHMLRRTSS